ncbi:hypothetical protein [Psychromonas antarctica]|uniref:hypothetical protein n=1 Tax=Psychromonas antarctica TaxID=67573 RepID=UPI001EE98380|nr:hypothetical protein [Psychromonas antarctica]MCG6202447.1 hypothetical protein [Psychromonas antarctica]
MVKKFIDTDPNLLDDDKRIILRYSHPRFDKTNTDYYYLLLDKNHLLWTSKGYFPSINGKPAKWTGGTDIEFPKEGLLWFIKSIEQKFLKTEAQGGLEKGAFTYSEEIKGEKLAIKRQFGVPGYGLMNFSREGHGFAEGDVQLAEFTDVMLFDNGLFKQFTDIAKQIENGEI